MTPKTNSQIHPNTIRQFFFIALLVFMGILIFKELYFMLSAFLGAITLYVILLYPMKVLVIRFKWPAWIAALVLMIVSFVIMVLPLVYISSVTIDLIMPLIKNPEILTNAFQKIHQYLLTSYNINVFNAENVNKISDRVLPFSQETLGGTMSALGNIFLMYLVLYFLLVQMKEVEHWLKKTVPLKSGNSKLIISEMRNLVYSNALGIPIVAIIQGAVASLGYSIFGVEEYLLMGVLTAIASVIPILGTLVIYLPLAIFQFSTHGSYSGIGVMSWGFVVIGSVDNIARFLVQKKLANVHPLVTLLGVFMGVSLFGFLGVIFGPLLLSIFFMLVRIYIDEFGKVNANHPDKTISSSHPGLEE